MTADRRTSATSGAEDVLDGSIVTMARAARSRCLEALGLESTGNDAQRPMGRPI